MFNESRRDMKRLTSAVVRTSMIALGFHATTLTASEART